MPDGKISETDSNRTITARRALDFTLRQWPVIFSMVLAALLFSAAIQMSSDIPLWSDAKGYSVSGWRITQSGVLNYGWAETEKVAPPNAFITPVYPLFLASFYSFAPHNASFADAARLVHPAVLEGQYLLAVGTVGLIAACGAALAGPGLALLAGVMAACYLPFAWATQVSLSESVAAFLLALQLLLSLRLVGRRRGMGAPTAAALGAVSALVVLVRPAFALWPVALLAFGAIVYRRQLRAVVRAAVFALVAFVLVMSPWWIRNAVSLHEVIVLSSGSSLTLLDSTGTRDYTPTEQAVSDRAEKAGEDPIAAVAEYRIGQRWKKSPAGFLKDRALMAVNALEYPYLASAFRDIRTSGTLREGALEYAKSPRRADSALPGAENEMGRYHRLLLVLALLSLAFAIRWPRLLVVAGLAAYTVAIHTSLLFINRYMFPSMPAVILMAAVFIWGSCLVVWRLASRHVVQRETQVEVRGAGAGDEAEGDGVLKPAAGWRRRLGVAAAVAIVSWPVLNLMAAPSSPLILELGTDRPIAGSIAYADLRRLGASASTPIVPEQVEVAALASKPVTVSVTPVGPVGARRRGTEVWLHSITSSTQSVSADDFDIPSTPAGWTSQPGAFVNAKGKGEPLETPVEAAGWVDLVFTRHPSSGGVEIASQGSSRTVDLFSTVGGTAPARLLLPVSDTVRQTVYTGVPKTANGLRLVLTGGPRTLRLRSAQWTTSHRWRWTPANASQVVTGPGVTVVSRRPDALVLRMDGSSGWVGFKGTGAGWLPPLTWWSLLVVLSLAVAYWGAAEEITTLISREGAGVSSERGGSRS